MTSTDKHEHGLNLEFAHTEKWLSAHYNRVHDIIENDQSEFNTDTAIAVEMVKFFFADNLEDWKNFAIWVQSKRCLDIGSGPISNACQYPFIKDWHVIDPLADKYRQHISDKFGRTVWYDDIAVYSQNAEDLIPDLVDSVDGMIICRNCLDHTIAPYKILDNIAAYAAPGCHLMLWNDLYHGPGSDKPENFNGHFFITKDREGFKQAIIDRRFKIIRETLPIRGPDWVEYGCVAVKI